MKGVPQELVVNRALAPEVVIEHGLVDPGTAGDAIDAGAGEAAGGELGRSRSQDALGRDSGWSCHFN